MKVLSSLLHSVSFPTPRTAPASPASRYAQERSMKTLQFGGVCEGVCHVLPVTPRRPLDVQRDADLHGWEVLCSCRQVLVFVPDGIKFEAAQIASSEPVIGND